jgi:protein-S-isoprenylcysteine O-methyltransferase Ste14
MFVTKKADWYFVIPAMLIWIAALIVTAWDFIQIQPAAYRFSFINLVGLSCMLTGVFVRRLARRDLGKYFSAGLRTLEDHRLIKDGIYKHLRHPAYSGSFLFCFGIPLLFSSLNGFLVMLALIPCFLYRIKVEEKMLVEKFGNEYLDYMKGTKKLLPYVY